MRVRFGDFAFDWQTRQLMRGREQVRLTPKALQLLQILLEHRPKAVSKNELIERLWPDVIVEEANVRNLVAEVRAAIDDTDREKRFIRTLPRFGYAFSLGPEPPDSIARLIHATEAYELSSGENVIGRASDCAVVLDRHGVSRRHACIRITPDRVVLQDLGSKNGTWLNGKRIESEEIVRDGDVLRIGSETLRFRQRPPEYSTETSED